MVSPANAISSSSSSSFLPFAVAAVSLCFILLSASTEAAPAPKPLLRPFSSSASSNEEIPSARRRSVPVERLMDQESGDGVSRSFFPLEDFEGDSSSSAEDSSALAEAMRSWAEFAPGRFRERSPKWNMQVIKFLLDMKRRGYNIQEVVNNKVPDGYTLSEDGEEGGVERRMRRNAGEGNEPFLLPQLRSHINSLKSAHRRSSPKSSPVVHTRAAPNESGEIVINGDDEEPIICKLEPFNVCYRLSEAGEMVPVGNTRPARLLRVYKRSG